MSQYTLRFGYSSSPSYGDAARIAQALPGYEVEGAGRHVRHSVPVDRKTLSALGPLLNIVRSWRSTELLLDGQRQSAARRWALERIIACFQAREQSGLEQLHCRGFPGLGGGMPCRLIERSLPWAPGAEYRDPELLPRLMLAHAKQAMVEVCPAYDHDAVMRALPGALRRRLPQRERGGLTMQIGNDQSSAAKDDRGIIERLLRGIDLGDGT